MSKQVQIKWLAEPEEHNYPAAESYLKLLYDKKTTARLVEQLKGTKVTSFKAKDIFRASALSLLGVSNFHVEKDLKKIRDGRKLSPLLLVRDEKHAKVVIADGYQPVLCGLFIR